jgi:glycosyltransferase involved in cell wall biosynthesis
LNKSSNIRVLFVGHLFPDWLKAKILDQKLSPIQTQRFGSALLDALISAYNKKVDAFSVAPLLDYPHSNFVISPKAKWTIDDTVDVSMYSYINLLGIKHFSRFLVTFLYISSWIIRNKSNSRIIVLHGVQSCKIWGVILSQIFGKCVIVPFLTDDIGLSTSWERKIIKHIRRVDTYLIKLGLKKVDGIISMTSQLARKLAPDRPALTIPAIHNSRMADFYNDKKDRSEQSFNVIYAGALSHEYGVDLLVNAFLKVAQPTWRLLITGKGSMATSINNFSKQNHQIQYLGFLDDKEFSKVLMSADVLVSPKLSSGLTASFSFPSKIVEFLGTGLPVISTNLPTFTDDFRKHLIISRSDSLEDFGDCLRYVSSWDDEERDEWKEKTLQFVKSELSPENQGLRIKKFIFSLS